GKLIDVDDEFGDITGCNRTFIDLYTTYVDGDNGTETYQENNQWKKDSLYTYQIKRPVPVGIALIGKFGHFFRFFSIGFDDPDTRKCFLYKRGQLGELGLYLCTTPVDDLIDKKDDDSDDGDRNQ